MLRRPALETGGKELFSASRYTFAPLPAKGNAMSTRIGYACLALGVPGSEFHTCTAKNAAPERLRGIVAQNLGALRRLIAYNAENGIRLFRITSDLIPFAGTPLNPLRWDQEFSGAFAQIGAEAARAGIRLSLHPGQYTVLNSPDPRVVENAAAELAYHDKILALLGVGPSGKLVLHAGGVYGDKAAALRRFCENWDGLCDSIRRRVVLENDERCYDIADVLALTEHLGIPAVFDVLHHAVHPPAQERPLAYWLERCARTWKTADGPQKLHYSQQNPGGRPGAHSATIDVARFLPFYGQARALGADIMLEVKDKNLSALKCIHATAGPRRIELLREDWARMEYAVLQHAPEAAPPAPPGPPPHTPTFGVAPPSPGFIARWKRRERPAAHPEDSGSAGTVRKNRFPTRTNHYRLKPVNSDSRLKPPKVRDFIISPFWLASNPSISQAAFSNLSRLTKGEGFNPVLVTIKWIVGVSSIDKSSIVYYYIVVVSAASYKPYKPVKEELCWKT